MIRIFKTSLSSSSDSPEGLTAELGQQASPGRRGFGPKSSGHRSPGGGASLLSNKRLTLPFLAFVAVLAAGLLFLMPGSLLQAQQNVYAVDYVEEGKGPVITLSSRDPEDVAPAVWSLLTSNQADIDGDGNANEDIMVGAVLKVGADGVLTQTGGTALTDGDIADYGDFKISQDGVLTFKSPPSFESPNGGQLDADEQTPANGENTYNVVVQSADRGDIIQRNWFRVIVNVTDMEEVGKVTLSHLQPEVDIEITASVSDPDGSVTGTTWKWFRSSSKSGPWEQIRDATSGDFHTAMDYTPQDDAEEDDRNMYLRAEAAYTDPRSAGKGASVVSDHPVQPAHEDNGAPAFSQTAVDRNILENTKSGTNIGSPVMARDPDSGDILQYTLGGTDVASFSIDIATGQLKTRASLDFDTTDEYEVTVTATDSTGGATDPVATVTISINNIDEAPDFTASVTKKDVKENATDLTVGTYTAEDPEDGGVTLSLSGDDASKFRLTGTTAGTRDLEFTGSPDFEARADSDGNNVYEVTVEASDGSNVGKENVTVKVINLNEAGEITFSGSQPLVGRETTATIADEDGVVPETVVWSWHRLVATDAAGAANEAAVRAGEAGTVNAISGATSAAYTPKAADLGMYLKARVTYADMTYDMIVDVPSPATAKVSLDPDNKLPVFDDGVSTDRYVVENTDADMNIAGEVNASDPNGDVLTYTLGGPDAASFDIESDTSGQLQTKAELNHEGRNRYTVTLTADDGRSQPNSTATITVNIHVTDADEEPALTVGGLTIFGLSTIEYLEKGMDTVATYTVAGPMADMATWSRGGDDADDFSLTNGVLAFGTSPDYEAPADADMDNIYRVTLRADDGTYKDTLEVIVTVINVDEPGKVTLSSMTPVVGVALTATLMDPDGIDLDGTDPAIPDANPTWMWSKSMTMDGEFTDITGAMSMSYTPVEADDSYYLRATVMYTDGHGPYKEATTTTTGMVTTVLDKPGTVRLSSMTPVVGVELTATLTDDDGGVMNEMWQWSKSMTMDGTFMDITTGATSRSYTPVDDDVGYYLQATVMYTDAQGPNKSAMATTTRMVTTVQDQDGVVMLSLMDPVVGVALTATLTDGNGGVTGATWQWSKSMTMDGTFMDITTGATSRSYTPVDGDVGYYLQVKVMYTDAQGPNKSAMETTTNKVVADADALLVARYDTNPPNGTIDKVEVIAAINDYLFGTGAAAISKADVIKLINLYLFGS